MADAPEPRPRLMPMRVPWRVDSEGGQLTLLVTECPEEQPTEVAFYALMLGPDPSGPFLRRAVRVLFEHGVAARLIPGDNDLPFNPFEYDNSAVAPPAALRDNLAAVIHDADERFRQDGIPADPGFYMVLPSPWLKELAIEDEEMTHYMLVGRYAAVEVLATGFRWEPFEPPAELRWFDTAGS